MFKIHAVQAQFGDCLILEFGTAARRRFILVDGGPPGTYAGHLDPSLRELLPVAKLDLVVLSHIDNDHIVGLLDLMAALEQDQANGAPLRYAVAGLWHNAFSKALDPDGEIAERMMAVMGVAGVAGAAMPASADAFLGVQEGSRLRVLARKLAVPVNTGFPDDLILVDTAPAPVAFGPLKLRIVGPSRANLEALRTEWLKWLARAEQRMSDPATMANSDASVPNLSSIVFHAECNGKTALLTGDARSDHILQGLAQAGLLIDGKLHVDVFKVPHHGSDRNATAKFFKTVTADKYVISADGKDGNPDAETLKWIVEAAKVANRAIEIVATNATPTIDELKTKFPRDEYHYKLTIKPKTAHRISVTLAE